MRLRILAGAFLFLNSFSSAFAARYVLFDASGAPTSSAETVIPKLIAGDTVVFSDGREFTLQQFLGSGQTTRVFALNDHEVLRIPILNVNQDGRIQKSNFINAWISGSQKLEASPLPHVRMVDYLKNEYAVAERIYPDFSLGTYLKAHPYRSSAPTHEYLELFEFARKSSTLSDVSDMHPDQNLHVKGRGWVLADWLAQVSYTKRPGDKDMFNLKLGALGIEALDPPVVEKNSALAHTIRNIIIETRKTPDLLANGKIEIKDGIVKVVPLNETPKKGLLSCIKGLF